MYGSGSESTGTSSSSSRNRDLGSLIGKCENIIAITFILADELTGLALVFAAKALVRSEDIKRDSVYYLGGTLVNLCFSVVMGFLIRLAVALVYTPS